MIYSWIGHSEQLDPNLQRDEKRFRDTFWNENLHSFFVLWINCSQKENPAKKKQKKTTKMTKVPTEAIYISIDLESSLGKIDDGKTNESEDPMEVEVVARTSQDPFREQHSKRCHYISPYPFSETDREIKEREKLSEAVGSDWSLTGKPGDFTNDSEWDWLPEDADDTMSLPLGEVETSMEEDIELEKIEDPASFWDVNVPRTTEDQTSKMMSSTVSLEYSS